MLEWWVVGISLAIASLLMGLSGFGFAIVAISMMSFVWPIKQIVPFLFVYSLFINLALLAQLWPHVRLRRIALQAAAFAPGALAGVYGLNHLPDGVLKLLIGLVLSGFALYSLLAAMPGPSRRPWGWHLLAGGVSGLLGGGVYMAGPPVIILNRLIHADRFAFKADLQLFFLLSNLYLAGAYGALGLFSGALLRLNLYFTPVVLVALWGGVRWCRSISESRFRGIADTLLLVMGALLIARALPAVLQAVTGGPA